MPISRVENDKGEPNKFKFLENKLQTLACSFAAVLTKDSA